MSMEETTVHSWNRDIPKERIMLHVVQSFDRVVAENLELKAKVKNLEDVGRRLAEVTRDRNAVKTELGNTVKKLKKQTENNRALAKQNEILGTEAVNLRQMLRETKKELKAARRELGEVLGIRQRLTEEEEQDPPKPEAAPSLVMDGIKRIFRI